MYGNLNLASLLLGLAALLDLLAALSCQDGRS